MRWSTIDVEYSNGIRWKRATIVCSVYMWRPVVTPISPRSLTYCFCLDLSVSLGMGEWWFSSLRIAWPDDTIPRLISDDDFGLSVRIADMVLYRFPLAFVSILWRRKGFSASAPDRFSSQSWTYLSWADRDGDRDWHTDHQFQHQFKLTTYNI